MILNKLDAGVEIRRVELVRNVPANRSELASLLDDTVHKGDAKQHRLPLRGTRNVELVLRYTRVGSLETSLDTLRWLVGELDRHLEIEILTNDI